MPELSLVGPRYKYPISDAELNRRLAAVQQAMKEEDIDCCIAQSYSGIFNSSIRYMIDILPHDYTTTLLIPVEGKMILLNHGPDNDDAPIPPTIRNVEKMITKPYCQPFGCTDYLAAETILKEVKARGFKKIGFIFKQLMSYDFGEYLTASLPDVEFVDFSRQFSEIKAVKSEEELELADRCVRAHEQLTDMIPSLIRPGRMEYEIIADLVHRSKYIGCDVVGNIAVGSAPSGHPAPFFQHYNANRRIEPGDTVTVMVEVAGPGGFYGELARTYCLGKPNQSLLDLFEIAKEAQHVVADAMKPGITGKELDKVFNDFVVPHGIPKNARFVGHGQGYDMMEAPTISPVEDIEIKENMFFAIHPELIKGGDFVICCDNFVVKKNGAVRVTRTEQEIVQIEY
ncbi:MAG: aminopeptidase P family protein [Clostridiales bacterium]|nr:aminopeptidase P family protein [Clostridiales bacterium]